MKSILLMALFATSVYSAEYAVCNFDETSEVLLLTDGEGTSIIGQVSGLGSNPYHGFHIHEFGDLSDGCTSCGGHFNPFGMAHGGPSSSERHVGDLGNIETDADGVALVDIFDKQVQLSGENSVIGRSIVIHEKEDDLGASGDPSGAAGSRLKCCIIEEY